MACHAKMDHFCTTHDTAAASEPEPAAVATADSAFLVRRGFLSLETPPAARMSVEVILYALAAVYVSICGA